MTTTARRRGRRALTAVAAAVTVGILAGCGTPGAGTSTDPNPQLLPVGTALGLARHAPDLHWAQRLQSGKKLFGVSVPGAPASLGPIHALTHRVRHTPDMVEYYLDWADPFDPVRASRACQASMLPVLTWESWDWQDTRNGATAVKQPAYAPRKIARGDYDKYIRATAESVASIDCPLMIRLDQEPNGYWYPWGLGTPGMHNTPGDYVRMWRHVWHIFHRAHVRNVLWSWSPNLLLANHPYPLAKLYPGNRYVDAVGLDGYLWHRGDTPASVFGPLEQSLQRFAARRPWVVAETGVAAGPRQAKGIKQLLHAVAVSKRLRGLIYLDQPAHRADWSFDSHPAALRAFRKGIAASAYAAGHR